MSVILGRHQPAVLCRLGDGTLVAPSYPGANERPDNDYFSSSSVIALDNYPSTTPDELVSLIRPSVAAANVKGIRILTGPCGYIFNGFVSAGFPPSPITGSPFTDDTRTNTPFSDIFPRWTGETAWDLQTYPATANFTPQGITSPSVLNYGVPGIPDQARYGVSYNTGTIANDPSVGGDSNYEALAEFKVLAKADEVCCWNEGATLELNVDVWKIDFTATYQSGNAGYFDFTLGSSSYDYTLTQTVTVDPSWESATFVPIATFTITQPSVGYFYFVNDFYISAVNAP